MDGTLQLQCLNKHQMNYEKELVPVVQARGRQNGPVFFLLFYAVNAIFIPVLDY